MKRRTKIVKEREKRKALKALGMANPGGESKYAAKKRGDYSKVGPAQVRPSWMERDRVIAASFTTR